MDSRPYNYEEEPVGAMASEPSIQEMMSKRRVPLSEAMKTSITLEESRRMMEERIYRHYHPEA